MRLLFATARSAMHREKLFCSRIWHVCRDLRTWHTAHAELAPDDSPDVAELVLHKLRLVKEGIALAGDLLQYIAEGQLDTACSGSGHVDNPAAPRVCQASLIVIHTAVRPGGWSCRNADDLCARLARWANACQACFCDFVKDLTGCACSIKMLQSQADVCIGAFLCMAERH